MGLRGPNLFTDVSSSSHEVNECTSLVHGSQVSSKITFAGGVVLLGSAQPLWSTHHLLLTSPFQFTPAPTTSTCIFDLSIFSGHRSPLCWGDVHRPEVLGNFATGAALQQWLMATPTPAPSPLNRENSDVAPTQSPRGPSGTEL